MEFESFLYVTKGCKKKNSMRGKLRLDGVYRVASVVLP